MTETKNLAAKMAAVMSAAETVAKNGRNEHFRYDYATEADILRAVRETLAAEGVAVIPAVQSISVRGDKTPITTLLVKFTFTDGVDSYDTIVVGEGADASDKGAYKALTGATKYAVLKTFLIPTGDDPENHPPVLPPVQKRHVVKHAPTPDLHPKDVDDGRIDDSPRLAVNRPGRPEPHDPVTGELPAPALSADLWAQYRAAPNATARAKLLVNVPPDEAGRIIARYRKGERS